MNKDPPVTVFKCCNLRPCFIMQCQCYACPLDAIVAELERMTRIDGRDHFVYQGQKGLENDLLGLECFIHLLRNRIGFYLWLPCLGS